MAIYPGIAKTGGYYFGTAAVYVGILSEKNPAFSQVVNYTRLATIGAEGRLLHPKFALYQKERRAFLHYPDHFEE
ncbi:MAG: hypothetical protein MZV70_73660 [Desulfobacterales bacterium]|nr:hypothetical protein [Desulfobacterales bacterium]